MQFGLDSVIGAILPGVGDILGTFLGLYQVLLSMLFGIPLSVVGMMVLYLIADAFIGIVPFLGDFLDVAFKANIYNLQLLEKELKKSKWAPIVVIPPADEWLPSGGASARNTGRKWWDFFKA
ncbi:uncharacterized protein STEHIDRAFT_149457 [Stereum hirsutum FP-91666 SS1]|uniref:uncharacterized protein n=1 Tax=Stereum hirsutum (strain FP-91666) TaxID=721885 RepID=UPI000444A8A0|nr:uncharacterized protein STEHIDRAFT_149457 [Stereum hirsutum FP-91666 SS1]EIM82325.1 hypothetical protein STEHIDRAFT_149457 [Stereum hirsutum FP-91666 SS1]